MAVKETTMTRQLISIMAHYKRKPICYACNKKIKLGSEIVTHSARGNKSHNTVRHRECWERLQLE